VVRYTKYTGLHQNDFNVYAYTVGGFQFVRDGHKAYAFMSWTGGAVSAVARGRGASATLQVGHFLEEREGGFHAMLHATEAADLQMPNLLQHLKDATKSNVVELAPGESVMKCRRNCRNSERFVVGQRCALAALFTPHLAGPYSYIHLNVLKDTSDHSCY
jgi:hypothetical protein